MFQEHSQNYVKALSVTSSTQTSIKYASAMQSSIKYAYNILNLSEIQIFFQYYLDRFQVHSGSIRVTNPWNVISLSSGNFISVGL